jgi:Mg-chelatase subunit ChlD
MSRLRPWAFWRRLQYGIGFLAFWCLVGTASYFIYFYTPASCFDNMQNGAEQGVDCGGNCVRICAVSVIPPEIVWADSFRIIDGQYNAVAYIENKNSVAATPALAYTFRLLDKGSVIAERSGVTILPPNSVYPVFEGRILTQDGRVPTETTIEIEEADMWLPATVGRNQFKTLDTELLSTDTRPRLNVKIENTELTEARKVEVVSTIFNRAGKPVTASQTFIDVFSPRSTKDIVFTWPNSIAKTVRSCEVPSDIILVLDRSGSMAADGGTPPEPLESAKEAAKSFVKQIRSTDLVGFLTYATTPSSPIEQTLTSSLDEVTSAIEATKMGEDGVQYTNMGAAFSSAFAELLSPRHRDDARKVVVFLTDGDVTRPVNPATGLADRDYAANFARSEAALAKEADVTVYTIGFGDFFNGKGEEVKRDIDLIRDLASDPTLYFEAPTVAELQAVYQEIANDLCEEGPTRIEIITKTSTNFAPLR